MKTTDRLKRAFDNPRLFVRGLNRAYHRRVGVRSENTAGIDVFNEDWDTLVILDACRYDMFEEVNHIEGSLSMKESKASATTEWLQANVDGRDLRDTVYVTANPQLERHREHWNVNFHEVINVWLDEGWDEETGTVLAETMTNAGIQAFERFPNKRIVVHYMQPHYPFVPSETRFDKKHLNTIRDASDSATGNNVWNQKQSGELDASTELLWELYVENLRYVLRNVESLVAATHGKTVITSDHGNYVGERAFPIPIREYGHPRGLYDESVVVVPWLEITHGTRRNVRSGTRVESGEQPASETVTDRLENLGYSA